MTGVVTVWIWNIFRIWDFHTNRLFPHTRRMWNMMICAVSKSREASVYQRSLFVSALAWFLAVVFFSQDSLDSGAALEESSGMELDADAVRDAENNINTARWALNQEHYGIVMALRCQEQFGPTQGFILWKHTSSPFAWFCLNHLRIKINAWKSIHSFCSRKISDLSVIVFGHVFCKMWRQVDFYDTVSVICIIWFIDWQSFSLN